MKKYMLCFYDILEQANNLAEKTQNTAGFSGGGRELGLTGGKGTFRSDDGKPW